MHPHSVVVYTASALMALLKAYCRHLVYVTFVIRVISKSLIPSLVIVKTFTATLCKLPDKSS